MKRVYDFQEGSASMNRILGGKGANLAEMTKIQLPVPTGFTVSSEACIEFLQGDGELSEELIQDIMQALDRLEKRTEKAFNEADHLLLVSVRSGAAISMPGMMDTILNLGLNDAILPAFIQKTNRFFGFDCYRRLLQMFGSVVYGIDDREFFDCMESMEKAKGITIHDFSQEDWDELIAAFKDIYVQNQHEFPQNPVDQLLEAVCAVFRSWNNHRAIVYRNVHKIPHDMGTAVNVQMMVFGNSGEDSGTGVVFTRNPATGEKELYGEFLSNAQGEDIVAGIRTPLPIKKLEEVMPEIYQQLLDVTTRLEHHYKNMQDCEFTIENGKLFMLQTRNGKRTGKAAVRIAVELAQEGILTKEEALLSVSTDTLKQLLHPTFKEEDIKQATVVGKGLAASPGAATGKIVFTAEEAKMRVAQGERVILVRQETSPEDIEGMLVSEAIVTSRGGLTSHAAVVARGLGTCCVVGCDGIAINEAEGSVRAGDMTLHGDDIISVNGNTGEIYLGALAPSLVEADQNFDILMSWADEVAKLGVKANAETVHDLQTALDFGATGVGLARTEHMFFGEKRLIEMRRMILAETADEKAEAIAALLEFQKEDFKAMYGITRDKTMIVRLLDPPIHEFLPEKEQDIQDIAKELGKKPENLRQKIQQLHELNPMLGHRGCRLGITDPSLYQMQVEAIMLSAIELKQRGIIVKPAIMIPLINNVAELIFVKEKLLERIEEVFERTHLCVEYTIGTMIELPRSCVVADQLAEHVDFFSFGTNDLTQTTLGFSRDDSASFMDAYISHQLLPSDPFQTIDVEGVGALIQMAVEKARAVKPELSIGICGEVGGDPDSIAFFNQLAIDYVSCSPYRIPLARLSVAQEAIKSRA